MIARLCLYLFLGSSSVAVFAAEGQRIAVPMRDEVELPTTVWIPGPGAWPTVLTRGYSPNGLGSTAPRWNQHGYVFVSQQTRGDGGNDGSRFLPDEADGYDCVEWIARQPWSNGKVAMWGGSYWGITQWRAAVAQPPALRAIAPGYSSAAYRDWVNGYWRNGALHLKMTSQGRVFPSSAAFTKEQWRRNLMFLPLIDMDRRFGGTENALWNDYIKHSTYDDYWKQFAMAEGDRYRRIEIPVYIMVGWRDYYTDSSIAAFKELRRLGISPHIRLRIDDGGHSGTPDFGETVRFFDHHLKGLQNGIRDEPPIKFQLRYGGWEQSDEWPPSGGTRTVLYLSSPQGTRTGQLTPQVPGTETPTRYRYDPADPVPTLGANGSHTYPEIDGLICDDAVDQRPNEAREDVLVFSTNPFAQDTRLVGPVQATIFAASTARDTDFVVRLIDVHPDGAALNITEGIVRARYRGGYAAEPALIEPGKTYAYTIDLLPTALLLRQGHRLRIHVTSSCFPLWDRNLNTGSRIGMDSKIEVAEQTIFHDADRPSRIEVVLNPD